MDTYIDIYAIRLENLETILAEDFGNKKSRLSEALVRQASSLSRYWSLGEKNYRRINDDAARDIEIKTGRPENWLDNRHSTESVIVQIDGSTAYSVNDDVKTLIECYQRSDPRGQENILNTAKYEASRVEDESIDSLPEYEDGEAKGIKSPTSKKRKPKKKK